MEGFKKITSGLKSIKNCEYTVQKVFFYDRKLMQAFSVDLFLYASKVAITSFVYKKCENRYYTYIYFFSMPYFLQCVKE